MSEIKIITEPTVRLVGRQVIDESAIDEFLKDDGVEEWETDTDISAQRLVEISGRLCYQSYAKPRPGGNAAYIGHILEVGHGSVVEHAVWNFIITGVDRSFSHELIRHRAGMSYSQRSQRFCDESEGSFVVPPFIKIKGGEQINPSKFGEDQFETYRDYAAFGIWLEAVKEAQSSYRKLVSIFTEKLIDRPLDCPKCGDSRINTGTGWCPSCEDYTLRSIKTENRKKAREAARSVLPGATETQIFVTMNGRAARNFLEQRGALAADAAIRAVAVKLCGILKAEAPNLFPDFEIAQDRDGSEYLTCKHHKV